MKKLIVMSPNGHDEFTDENEITTKLKELNKNGFGNGLPAIFCFTRTDGEIETVVSPKADKLIDQHTKLGKADPVKEVEVIVPLMGG